MLIDTKSEEMTQILDKFLGTAFGAFGDRELTPLNKKEWIKNWQETHLKDVIKIDDILEKQENAGAIYK